jgi:hypothetical protein
MDLVPDDLRLGGGLALGGLVEADPILVGLVVVAVGVAAIVHVARRVRRRARGRDDR